MILVAKYAFFEPKEFFCENLLQPFLTYDDTLLSCKKSAKINDPIFPPSPKNPVFCRFLAQICPKNFFPKIGLRHIRGSIVMHLCAKNQKKIMMQIPKKHIFSRFLAQICPIFAPSHSRVYSNASLCQKIIKFEWTNLEKS